MMLLRSLLLRSLLATLPLLALLPAIPCHAEPSRGQAPAAIRRQLLEERPVEGLPALVTQLWLIEYPPGASAPPHRHPVAGMGYVVEGSFDSAFANEAVAHVHAGQSFFDPPQREHRLFRNSSARQPLKFVIAYTIPRGTPIVEFSRAVHLDAHGPAIEIASPALYPETLEVNPITKKFLIGSVREGAVYEVGLDGAAKRLIQDDRLTSILGIAVDPRSNRLLVTNSDLGAGIRHSPQGPKKEAAIASYDLASGRALKYVDLAHLLPAQAHLINGITVDPDGNAYATDSLSPAIYRVDREGNASIFLQHDEFDGPGINLNGIVYHPKGFLLAVKKSTGALYRIPLSDPRRFTRVHLATNLSGGDGLLLAGDQQLLVIANQTPTHQSQTAFALKSTNDWTSAELIESAALGNTYPTTCVALDGKLYALSSHLDEWLGASSEARSALARQGRTGIIRQIGVIDP